MCEDIPDDIRDCHDKSLDWLAGRVVTLRHDRLPIGALFCTSHAVIPRRPWDIGKAGTWAARLRAMLPLAVAKDRRYFPIEQDKENDCSLGAAKLSACPWCRTPNGLLRKGLNSNRSAVKAQCLWQHPGNSGFPFLPLFTDAVQRNRALERTDLLLGGSLLFWSFFPFYSPHPCCFP